MNITDRADAGVTLGNSICAIDEVQWDNLAGANNPFVSHALLGALEASESANARTGWQPLPILAHDRAGVLTGAIPAYVKSHSQGEYVFDHNWADAFTRAGGQYYPKLQIAVPFSPVPGPRILTDDDDVAAMLIEGAEAVVDQHGLSSAHATFLDSRDCTRFETAGWALRAGTQFHWSNDGYSDFDDFLDALSSRKRKAIRKERAAAQAAVDIVHLSGADITEAHWDAFWQFYQDTSARKWGQPYLTRQFFTMIGRDMADSVILILALKNGVAVAGALNLIGSDALYGRYWGCTQDIPFLHFELCYYQAIDAAIARGLKRVEAGAQGEHKLARGYVPVTTWSAHYIANPGFRAAVYDFLARERMAVAEQVAFLGEFAPFKKSG